ncbi:hypothetical protein EV361DRAFT_951417 [Lentinula raphanica]|uniref:Uncharacterized protein n=1 Tax=Lentinula raphanica TaxID=153919 RepID=A0AA38P642_9AGAR|nr:hypothetical protein F5880DRAFT_1613703 [Lentinula raphanica]KAJ3836830.1 hypothetical protein F5878DRAFT_662630 [Lentinula raphanica]KAJ3969500.1 hypothetical protein EV361DRAFT_951417 [Lentinula raphanica]
MSVLSALTPGEILACMFSNSNGTFHWGIFLVVDERNAYKLQARQYGSYWRFEEPKPHDLLASSTLCAMVKIGTFPLTNFETIFNHIVPLMREIPMTVPLHEQAVIGENIFHCRVWFREAVRKLHDNGYIHCPNVWALYEECMGHAQSNDMTYIHEPPKYFISRHSSTVTSASGPGAQVYGNYWTNQTYGAYSTTSGGNPAASGSNGGYFWGHGGTADYRRNH